MSFKFLHSRLHHIQTNLRLTLLTHLNGLGGDVSTNRPVLARNTQLSLCIESTALRIITSLGNSGMERYYNARNINLYGTSHI